MDFLTALWMWFIRSACCAKLGVVVILFFLKWHGGGKRHVNRLDDKINYNVMCVYGKVKF